MLYGTQLHTGSTVNANEISKDYKEHVKFDLDIVPISNHI